MRSAAVLALAATANILALPTTAVASTGGAERAVEREITFDQGDDYRASVDCRQRKRNRYYTCDVTLYQRVGGTSIYSGRARVWQTGSRYRVNYRIDW